MIEIITVDAFTDRAFAGNPAAVCLLDGPRDHAWMHAVAREMRASATAYLLVRGEDWSLRWFTSAVELSLCGHATLASAHALWEIGRAPRERPLRFHTQGGVLTAKAGAGNSIELDFPAEPAIEMAASDASAAALAAALGIAPHSIEWCGRNRLDVLLALTDEATVRALAPDFTVLAAAIRPHRGVIVTARSAGAEFDFVSRYFAPGVGIDEDPVTGSAHCCLAPFWAERLGRTELHAWQASARGGSLRMRVRGERVDLIGQAVTIVRGELVAR